MVRYVVKTNFHEDMGGRGLKSDLDGVGDDGPPGNEGIGGSATGGLRLVDGSFDEDEDGAAFGLRSSRRRSAFDAAFRALDSSVKY
jgi:hypothetical protein